MKWLNLKELFYILILDFRNRSIQLSVHCLWLSGLVIDKKLRNPRSEHSSEILFVLMQSPEKSTASTRNGNLSLLKQLWEQPAETPRSPEPKTHSRQTENHQQQPLDPSFDTPLESTYVQLLSDSDQPMEKWTPRDVETPTVPLNSLKMMFEKGETIHNNVSTTNHLNWYILS